MYFSFSYLYYIGLTVKSQDIAYADLSLINSSELAGAGREMTPLRGKSSQKTKIVRKSHQIFPKPRIRFVLTRVTPLWYNIQGGKGDNLHFYTRLRVRIRRKRTEFSHWRATAHAGENKLHIITTFGAAAVLKGQCASFI
jgi:hypothetical protein